MNSAQIRDKVNDFIKVKLEQEIVPWHKTWSTIQIGSLKPYT